MSGPRMNAAPINGNSRRPNYVRVPPIERPSSSQHDDLIKFIQESWSKVSQEVGRNAGNTATYYREQEPEMLKNFEPFDLDAYWGKRGIQNVHQ
ncbi:MAPK regulated corepressor interacting protein 2-like [Photinus pyralis]|uniref:MAPK regulated corepressor interacting protein 2-like n=1 Tax=Photinus pyralis TaxID=7054 RepID=UPI0012676D4D|nr:MAPK regulated corepressor interacting protein 2-like [Photinus pyralis]